jgi:hypothetical protein
MPVSKIFFYVSPRVSIKQGLLITQNFTFLSKSPVKEHPCHSPPRVLLWERCSVLRVSGLIIHLYLSESPFKQLTQIAGKDMVTVHGAACGRKFYIQWVRPGAPRGLFTTLLLLFQCHAAFITIPSTLAWADKSPVSQCVIVTLYSVSLPHLLAPPMWPRVQIST